MEKCPVPEENKANTDNNTVEKKEKRKELLTQQAETKIQNMKSVVEGFKQLAELEEGQIKLYRVKANDLDDQIRQAVNDTDTLKFLYDGDISFRRFQAYLFFVSCIVHMFSFITTAANMDVVLMKDIDKLAKWEVEKTYCAQQWSEDNYKDPIKILIASHLFLFIGLSITATRQEKSLFWPVVFDYTKIRTSDLTEEFPKQFLKNFIALIIVIGATTVISFGWMLSI